MPFISPRSKHFCMRSKEVSHSKVSSFFYKQKPRPIPALHTTIVDLMIQVLLLVQKSGKKTTWDVLKTLLNNGISTTNLNWCNCPNFWLPSTVPTSNSLTNHSNRPTPPPVQPKGTPRHGAKTTWPRITMSVNTCHLQSPCCFLMVKSWWASPEP